MTPKTAQPAENLLALGAMRARVWDARHGIKVARETLGDMIMDGSLPDNPALREALRKAEDAVENALREIYNQIEEASE